LFLEATIENNHALKWMLLGSEDLSGMKINFMKSVLVPLNLIDLEGTHLAEQLGYKFFFSSFNVSRHAITFEKIISSSMELKN
jgi:hypothetical protein